VPLVQTINITFGHAGDTTPPPSSDDPHITHVVLRHRNLEAGEQRPSWLPEGVDSTEEPTRAMGRLMLHQNARMLANVLSGAVGRISNLANTGPLSERGIEETDPSVTHLFFAANLADPPASGMLLDMAYLARGEVTGSQCWALLMLPTIFTEQHTGGAIDSMALNEESLGNARAYATLKELDYYMDIRLSDMYSSSYYGRGGVGRIQSIRQEPFEHVYIIGKRNRAALSLSGAHNAAAMLGEWLYQVIFTHIGTSLTTGPGQDLRRGKVSAYSSLGLSYAYLPTEDLLNYLSNRLASQIISERLLNTSPSDANMVASNVTATFRTQNTLNLNELKKDLMVLDGEWLSDESRTSIGRFTENFSGLSDIYTYEADVTEAKVIEQYNERLDGTLPRLEEHLSHRLRRKMQEFVSNLERERNVQLDMDNDGEGGTPRRTRGYFNHIIGELRKEQDEAIRQTEKGERDLANMGNAIRAQRAMYRLAANGFGTIPLRKETPLPDFLWHSRYIIMLYLLLLGLAYFAYRFTAETLGAGLWGLLLVVGIIAIVAAMTIYSVKWLQSSREKLIDSYLLRLRIERELALLKHAVQFYAFAIQQVGFVLAQVQEFIEDLESAQTSLSRNLTSEMKARLLSNSDEGLAEMVLVEEDIERAYVEAVGEDIGLVWRRLKAERGQISSWRGNPDMEPFDLLRSFARSFLRKIEDYSIDEILSRRDETRLRNMLLHLRSKASPFWELDRVTERDMPEPYCLIGVPNAESPSILRRVAEKLDFHDPPLISTGNKKRVTFVGNQSSLPLYTISTVMSMRNDYLRCMEQDLVAHLHVSKDSMLIPDLQPVGDDLVEVLEPYSGRSSTPQLITTLGLTLGLITEQGGMYQFSYPDEAAKLLDIERQIVVRVGPTKEAASAYFNDHRGDLDILRDQVRHTLDQIAEIQEDNGVISTEHLKKVNTFIFNHREQMSGRLEEWEDLRLLSFYEGVTEKLRAQYATT
jgi:hypothetical protein